MATLRPKDEPPVTAVLSGDIFLIDGATGVRGLAASVVPILDANANATINNVIEGFTSIATAAGTTTLTAVSAAQQFFTGTTTQTVLLPVTSTLKLGQSWFFQNSSTGAVTIQSSGANAVKVIGPGAFAIVTCIAITGTTAASWQATYFADIVVSGKVLTLNNSLTLAGTDGTTMTFPATSAALARTDTGQTFSGTQAFGALTATTVNGNTWTAGTGTLAIGAGKSVAISNGINIAAGSDSTTQTFPATSGTVVTSASVNTITNAMRTQMAAFTLKGNATGALANEADIDVTALTLKAAPVSGDIVLIQDSAASNAFKKTTVGALSSAGSVASLNGQTGALLWVVTPGGRLSLTSGVPVTESDVTGATTIYLTTGDNDFTQIWDGTNWVPRQFTQQSLILDATGHLISANYDVWEYWDGSAVRIGTGPAWGTNISRGTGGGSSEVQILNGRMTNANAIFLRNNSVTTAAIAAGKCNLRGSFRTTVAGLTEDSFAKRFLSNVYNIAPREMKVVETADSWPNTGAVSTPRQLNGNTANQIAYIHSVAGRSLSAHANLFASNNSGGIAKIAVGIGINSATVDSSQIRTPYVNDGTKVNFATTTATYRGYPGIG